ncbi:MAG TPA: diadenylate cyclase CdaA [Acidobacteriota bacterium]|jgi:diadenylate cyclase|nr:diadenylate cyclase CdaA [Acidobacteriota bacterium]HNT18346.1 diadenylate cyclase CdaA [Acidobacteriota bacterium]HPA27958.1 diadenylate cyclase CdaA [Acidobacteriota bacterium]HQO20595.1 diadenylate cyclase CdaA [Acidobacteriota bacterium]HQQ47958.1 diadenylate cyclase CdaA [Acidobacteriota bacterium]
MVKAWEILVQRGFFWFDVVDILVVAALIYLLISHIRGTRAVQIFAGILLLYVGYVASGWFMMTATHRLLEKTFFYIPFIVIVLFQPTMRNILAAIGGMVVGRRGTMEAARKACGEVSRAAFTLASQRFGALIVFERRQGLKNYAASGVPLGSAELTADLLLTIFYPKTPLHDGAVIISEGSVLAAGCFLPLSSLPIPTLYGTRHRAALGLTEETDAVAVVVSEERGEVSVSFGGRLERVKSEEKLEAYLHELLGGPKQ